MATSTLAVSAPTTQPPVIHAPNWDEVPFDVRCARCGWDLRGLEEPKCPACSLEFDWAEAVPLEELTCLHCGYRLYGLRETRCPECGASFAWHEVLTAYQRRRKPLFEYRWWSRPARSFIRSWLLTLRPWKLWSTVDLHDPPQPGPLIVTVAAWVGGMTILFPVLDGVWTWLSRRSWPRAAGSTALWPQITAKVSDPESYFFLLPLIALLVSSLLALMVFRESMRRYNVCNAHVFRVWAYAMSPTLPLIPMALFGWFCLCRALRYVWVRDLQFYLITVSLVYAAWSIQLGYRRYLRIPHSAAVAITVQLMTLLGASVICDITLSDPSVAGYLTWLLEGLRIL